jgi:hypothetical protein
MESVTIKCRDIIEELGLNNLSSEKKDELISQMSNIVSDKIILKVIERINEDEVIELNSYLDSGKMDKVDSFLNNKVSDFSNIIQAEINNFQEEMLKKISA